MPNSALWLGRRFSVRIEYYSPVRTPAAARPIIGRKDSSCAAPKPEAGKYIVRATSLQGAVVQHFDGELPVSLVPVSVPYALEVSVAPGPVEDPDAAEGPSEEPEAALVFSKLQARAWPQVEEVLAELRRFCQLPVYFSVFRPPEDEGARSSGGQEAEDPAEDAAPLRLASLRVQHPASSDGICVGTDDAGTAEVVLFPGHFLLSPADASTFDEFSPGGMSLRAVFEACTAVFMARPRCWCSLSVRDHVGQPLPGFQLRVSASRPAEGRRPASQRQVHLQMDGEGRCDCLLPEGEYTLAGEGEAAASLTLPFERSLCVCTAAAEVPRRVELVLTRVVFPLQVLLHTQGGGPVPSCGFTVVLLGEEILAGVTDDHGLARVELKVGTYELRFVPAADSPLGEVAAQLELQDNGDWSPKSVATATKTLDVTVFFVTDDGEPADHCICSVEHVQSDLTCRSVSLSLQQLDSGPSAAAKAQLALFESYRLNVTEDNSYEYEPQVLDFRVRGDTFTAVVHRSLLGRVVERRFVLVLDASGAYLQACLADAAEALRRALGQPQLLDAAGTCSFGLIAYASSVEHWRPGLVPLTCESVDEAAAFCAGLGIGSGPDACQALEAALQLAEVEAIYFVTSEQAHVDELFAKRARLLLYKHARRPRLHAVLLDGEPRRKSWKHLQALALSTSGTFRHATVPTAAVPDGADNLGAAPV